MSVDTTLRLLGHIPDDKLTEFIRVAFDMNVVNHVREEIREGIPTYAKVNYGPSDCYTARYGRVDFKYPLENGESEDRSLFYSYSTINVYENLDHYTEKGAREMVLAETTYCSVGMWGHTSEIMERIARAFDGGWIEDNDCKGMPPRWVSGSDAPSFFFHRIDMLSGGYCLLVARAQGIVDKFPALSYVGGSFVLAAPKYGEVEANIAKAGKEMSAFFGSGFSFVDTAKVCEMCKDFAFVYVPDKDAFVLPATLTADGVHAYMDYLSKKMTDKGYTVAAEALSKYATATITE